MNWRSIKKKFLKLKEKYHLGTNYRRIINQDYRNWGVGSIIIITLFLYFGLRNTAKVDKQIMESIDPTSLYLFDILIMLIFIMIVLIYRKIKGRPLLTPYYKKPELLNE